MLCVFQYFDDLVHCTVNMKKDLDALYLHRYTYKLQLTCTAVGVTSQTTKPFFICRLMSAQCYSEWKTAVRLLLKDEK